MCTAKAPKTTPVKEKDPQYMRNPWLDQMSMNRSATVGRNALRIDGARAPTGQLPPPVIALPPPSIGGGGNRGGYSGGGGFARLPDMNSGGRRPSTQMQ